MTIFEINGRRVIVRRLPSGKWEAFGDGVSAEADTMTAAIEKREDKRRQRLAELRS